MAGDTLYLGEGFPVKSYTSLLLLPFTVGYTLVEGRTSLQPK